MPLPKFGTLAENLRNCLVDFRKMDMPVDELVDRRLVRDFGAECQRLLPVLNRAHRMVLSEDFTHLAGRFSISDPPELLTAWTQIARMPFETLWVEWPEKARFAAVNGLTSDDDLALLHRKGGYLNRADKAADKVGMLISPDGLLRDVPVYRAIIVWMQEGHGVQLCPIGYTFSFKEPLFGPDSIDLGEPANNRALANIRNRLHEIGTEVGTDTDMASWPKEEREKTERLLAFVDSATTPMGRGYLKNLYRETDGADQKLGAGRVTEALVLAAFAATTLVPPIGREMHRIMERYSAGERNEELVKAYRSTQNAVVDFSTEINGDWRFLLGVLTLLSVRPETDLHVEHVQPKKHVYVKGRFFPAYEYRVVTITAPQTEAFTRLRKQIARVHQPRRWHTVRGFWAYSRKKGDRACGHTYARSTDKHGKLIGSDQYRCTECGAKKWWVPSHARGDRRIGVVDKGYEVEAGKDGERPERKHRTLEVIDLDNIRDAPIERDSPPEEEAKPA